MSRHPAHVAETARRSHAGTRPGLPSVSATRVVIEPIRGWQALNLHEVWRYRELIYFLAWRDIKVRYKQTILGVTWAGAQPFVTMVVFSVIFGRLVQVPSEGAPYPVFLYAALLPWTAFAAALNRSGSSLVSSADLLTKVYFPRLVVALATLLPIGIDFAIASTVLIGLMLFYGIVPGLAVLTLPLFLLLAFLTAFAVSLWLGPLNVKYRDVGHLMPFLTQVWFFLTPVAYPSSLVPEPWRLLYGLNPMAGVVEGFRWALLGHPSGPGPLILASAAAVLLLLAGGLFYFRRAEDEFADVV